MNVFYSWQSDLNHETHLNFIRVALQRAIKLAGDTLGLEEANRPELDEAAKDRKGAENIVGAILRKIEAAAIYVADVTPINRTARGRLVPNPNVIFELGFASKAVGYERTVLVMNGAEGYEIKDMPFDIVQRPIIRYDLKPSSTPEKKDKELSRLAEALASAITTNLSDHLTQVAASQPITRRTALNSDPSRWKKDNVEMQGYGGQLSPIVLTGNARAYVRVSPAGWKGAIPLHNDFLKAPDNMRPEILPGTYTTGSSSHGRCEEGAVRYWRKHDTSNDNVIRSNNFSVFFEVTGELWTYIDAFFMYEGKTILDREAIFPAIKHTLTNSHAFLDHFNATSRRQVEAGFVGMAKSHLPVGNRSTRQSLKPTAILNETYDNWDASTQQAFRLGLLRKVYDAYALPLPSLEDLVEAEGR